VVIVGKDKTKQSRRHCSYLSVSPHL
jgi:hypothetical protein